MGTTISVCKDERYWKKTDIKLPPVVYSSLELSTVRNTLIAIGRGVKTPLFYAHNIEQDGRYRYNYK